MHPPTQRTTCQIQPPSAYSGTRSYTAQTQASLTPSLSPSFSPSHFPGLTPSASASATRSSWLPSPHRANTSSTVSGAYPHELRRDPDLAAPLSWANRFPDPPQTFPQAHGQAQTQTGMQTVAAVYPQATAQTQTHSARTLPIPPGPQSQTQQMLSPPPKGYPESARTF